MWHQNSSWLRLLGLLTVMAAALVISLSPAPAQEQVRHGPMKAVRFHEYGGPEVLRYEGAPIPRPGEGELLVRVYAAGVNPVDAAVRRGGLRDIVKSEPPITLGYDVSGRVERVGEGVTQFQTGDRVFAFLHLSRPGAYAQYAIVRESEAARKPRNISHTDAAGVPLVALTAWQALVERAEIKRGQTVLIHAGAGGVGTMAIQIARSRGAKVIATASEANHKFLRSLGAHEVIDYTTERFEERVKDVDVVLDPIGGDTQERSWQVLKKDGMLISIVQPPDQDKARQHGVVATWFLVKPHAMHLAKISELIEQGTIKPVTTKVLPLAEAAEAHRQIETRHTRGKIVLEVDRAPEEPEPDGVPKLFGIAVLPDGRPAASLPVMLRRRDGKDWVILARGLTNTDGEFSIRGLPEGVAQLEIGDSTKSYWCLRTVHNPGNAVVDIGQVMLRPPGAP